MSRRTLVIAVLLTAVALSLPAFAGDLDWTLRLAAISVQPTGDLQEPGEEIEMDSAVGVRLAAEFMVNEKIGIEPALTSTSHDVEVEPDDGSPEFVLGEVDALMLTTTVNFHVGDFEKVDLYLGPTLAYVMWDDLKSEDFGSFKTDDEFAFGATVGLDVPCGDRWSFSAGLSWLLVDLGFSGGGSDLGVDPILMSVGVSYRF